MQERNRTGPPARNTTPTIGEQIVRELREIRVELGELRDELGATNGSIEDFRKTMNVVGRWVDEQQ